jgi:hypothetical protein
MENLVIKSYSYLMNSSYERIAKGKGYDISFKPYEKKFISKMIQYFEDIEEYEKCQVLVNFMNNRFDHEKNYMLV